jgi:radical SAM protein
MSAVQASPPGTRSNRPRFEERPVLVFWETTRACALSCRHCRATAQQDAAPGELSTELAHRLLEEVAGFGPPRPILVLTGGDCLARPDILELVSAARALGLVVALSPSVTLRLNPEVMGRMHALGVRSVSISLDGAAASTHDRIRGVPGHQAQTLEALSWLRGMGFKVQVNTTVMRSNATELADLAALLHRLGIPVWEVFFLVEVGRGRSLTSLEPAENAAVCQFLYSASQYGFLVRTVEAPFFRRVVAERLAENASEQFARVPEAGGLEELLAGRLLRLLGPPLRRPMAQGIATRDGMGVIFVGHDGAVRPSGFLPLALGNVKHQSLREIYRENPLLRSIRRANFHGRCGCCSYRHVCGGSRARAYAGNGDPLGEDPGCQLPVV